MMQILLRVTRAALIAAVAYFASRYLGLEKAATFIAAVFFAFALLSYFFKFAAIASSALIIWAGAHFVLGVPDAQALASGKARFYSVAGKPTQEAAPASAKTSVTETLTDIEAAHKKGLLSDDEYKAIRARVIANIN